MQSKIRNFWTKNQEEIKELMAVADLNLSILMQLKTNNKSLDDDNPWKDIGA